MIIYLIRHGQTEYNDKSIFRGQLDIPLNSYGIGQAESVGKALETVDFDAIYTSPLIRAKRTAEIISKHQSKKKNIDIENDFTDLNYGAWQAKSHKEVKNNYPQLYYEWGTRPYNIQIPGGESLYEVQKRSFNGLKKIINKNNGKIICIVSHRVINKLLISKILGIPKTGFWKIRQDTGCINIIEYQDKKFIIIKLNYNTNVSNFINSLKVVDF
jgi:phosphoserine phosphatase